MLAYNEEEWIRATVDEVLAATANLDGDIEILVLDDGSTDRTRAEIEALIVENELVHGVFHDLNQGIGAGIRSLVSEMRGDFVLLLPGDHSYSQTAISAVLAPLGSTEVDIVTGVRLANGSTSRSRRMASRLVSLNARLLGGSSLIDVGGLNVYRRELLNNCLGRSTGYTFMLETIVNIGRTHPRVARLHIEQIPASGTRSQSASWKRLWPVIVLNTRLVGRR